MITLPTNTRIWIAAGVTDLRRGFTGLSALVQTALEQDPLSGHVFVFRGRRGDLIKVLCSMETGFVCLPSSWLHTTPLSIGSEGLDSFPVLKAAARSESRSHRLQCLAGGEGGNS
jgi:hypothetical protein